MSGADWLLAITVALVVVLVFWCGGCRHRHGRTTTYVRTGGARNCPCTDTPQCPCDNACHCRDIGAACHRGGPDVHRDARWACSGCACTGSAACWRSPPPPPRPVHTCGPIIHNGQVSYLDEICMACDAEREGGPLHGGRERCALGPAGLWPRGPARVRRPPTCACVQGGPFCDECRSRRPSGCECEVGAYFLCGACLAAPIRDPSRTVPS